MEYAKNDIVSYIFLIVVILLSANIIYAGGTETEIKKAEDTIIIPGGKEVDESRTLIQSLENEYFSLYPEKKPDQKFYYVHTGKTISVNCYGVIDPKQQDAVQEIVTKIKNDRGIIRSITIQYFDKESWIKTPGGQKKIKKLLRQIEIK